VSRSFKEAFWTPGALYVCVRERINKPGWQVRVLNFATWVHKTVTYETEQEARDAADLWRI
jgi:hypothetical protein